MAYLPSDRAKRVKQLAAGLGFDFCGISRAAFLEEEAPGLEDWLKQGRHGTMAWMENHFDKRLDPTKLVPGAKSVVSLMLNYYPEETLPSESAKISRYAYGRDYHKVLKKRMVKLIKAMQGEWGDFVARAFVDSAPVMERAWAEKSGLAWRGKHSLSINKGSGSYYFLGEIICDLELEPDGPATDHCGTCTRCMDACPTDAIPEPYQVDGSRCISYLTIELKEEIPQAFQDQMQGWAFGCDICQEVCPWNRFSRPHQTPDFSPKAELHEASRQDFEEISQEYFSTLFAGTPVKRAKWEGFRRNLDFIKKKA